MIKKLLSIGLLIFLFNCNSSKNEQKQDCLSSILVSDKANIIPQYKLTLDSLSRFAMSLRIDMLESEYQAEREYIFYLLADLKKCELNVKDSIKILFVPVPELSSYRYEDFKFSYSDILENLQMRDSISAPGYNNVVSYMINKRKNFIALTTIFSHYLGVAMYDDDDGMYNEDFFVFLLSYTKDVHQMKTESRTFYLLDSIEEKINNSEMLSEYKMETLDVVKYLKNLRKRKTIV